MNSSNEQMNDNLLSLFHSRYSEIINNIIEQLNIKYNHSFISTIASPEIILNITAVDKCTNTITTFIKCNDCSMSFLINVTLYYQKSYIFLYMCENNSYSNLYIGLYISHENETIKNKIENINVTIQNCDNYIIYSILE